MNVDVTPSVCVCVCVCLMYNYVYVCVCIYMHVYLCVCLCASAVLSQSHGLIHFSPPPPSIWWFTSGYCVGNTSRNPPIQEISFPNTEDYKHIR